MWTDEQMRTGKNNQSLHPKIEEIFENPLLVLSISGLILSCTEAARVSVFCSQVKYNKYNPRYTGFLSDL